MTDIGYVVIEWNQASHQPSVVDGSFTDDADWAGQIASDERARAKSVGRRERYDIAVVQLMEEAS